MKKCYIDFDGTLVNTIKSIVDLYNEDFQYYDNYKRVCWEDIKSWDFTELNCSTPDYIDTYFNQKRFFDNLLFMPHSLNFLESLYNKGYEIYIVSMGNTPNLKIKETWLRKHVPYCKFIGCDFKDYKDKEHIDMSDADFFIDDCVENLLTSNCPRKICYGEILPWNENWDRERILDWGDFNV